LEEFPKKKNIIHNGDGCNINVEEERENNEEGDWAIS